MKQIPMKIASLKKIAVPAAVALLLFAGSASAEGEDTGHWGGPLYLSVYSGVASMDPFWQVAGLAGEYIGSQIVVTALNQTFYTEERYRWEVETSVGKHFGRQHHWESTVALLFRWTHFIWNDAFPTTFALGEGFSYATRLPAVEVEDHTHTSKLLNHLVVEWTVGLPEWEDWELNFRVHHRSGIYGTIDGVNGGSDFVCLGVRYRF